MPNHDKQPRAGSRIRTYVPGGASIPRFAAAFTLAVLVSGCTKLGPDFLRPETDVQKEWMEAETSEFKPVEPTDDGRWWTVFGDPVLDRLVQVAYQQNLTLKTAGVRILEARAQLGIATGMKYPQSQSLDGSYAYARNSINSPPLSGRLDRGGALILCRA